MQWGFIAAAVAALLLIWKGGDLWTWATAPKATAAVTPDDPDVADMQALKRLTARFTAVKCKEGIEAMQTAAKHFFHDAEAA